MTYLFLDPEVISEQLPNGPGLLGYTATADLLYESVYMYVKIGGEYVNKGV